MNRTRYAALITGILIAAFASTAVLAQSGASPLGIIPTPTPTTVTVSISTDKTSYAIGENVTITYTVSQAAYIYILDIQPDGIVRQVFPNQYSAANYVAAGTHTLPDGSYRFAVSPPNGAAADASGNLPTRRRPLSRSRWSGRAQRCGQAFKRSSRASRLRATADVHHVLRVHRLLRAAITT
jgi:hypothetical protein